jgi:sugar phosphate isomerase/epimerase
VQCGPNLPLYELPGGELEEVLAASREWGIELEVGTRGVETAHLLKLLEFTAGCGSALLRTVPEVEGGRVPSQQELEALLRAVEPQFRQGRVRLAMENTLMPAAELEAALRAVGSEFLGITLDTVNSLAIPEGTREVVGRLAAWTRCLHVKDFAVRREWHMMGFRVEGRPAGQGQLNVPWLLEELRRGGARCNASSNSGYRSRPRSSKPFPWNGAGPWRAWRT